MPLLRPALAALLSLALLAACDEISSEDDPRSRSTFREPSPDAEPPGRCTGLSTRCNDRAADICAGGGCLLEDACQGEHREHCFTLDDPDSCEADDNCIWGASRCHNSEGFFCTSRPSEALCLSEERDSCVWAPICEGYAELCIIMDTQAECEANHGCEWELR